MRIRKKLRNFLLSFVPKPATNLCQLISQGEKLVESLPPKCMPRGARSLVAYDCLWDDCGKGPRVCYRIEVDGRERVTVLQDNDLIWWELAQVPLFSDFARKVRKCRGLSQREFSALKKLADLARHRAHEVLKVGLSPE